jgi:hypothetical protein
MKTLTLILTLLSATAANAGTPLLCTDNGRPFGAIELDTDHVTLHKWGASAASDRPIASRTDDEIRIQYNSDRQIILTRLAEGRYGYSFIDVDPKTARICSAMTPEAFAEYLKPAPKPPAKPAVDPATIKTILGVYDSCGYCSRHDNYFTSCTIDRDGTVTFTDERTKNDVKSDRTETYQLSKSKIDELLRKIELAQAAETVGEAKTYSGDAPTFSVRAWPRSDLEFKVVLYSDGKEYRDSHAARQLARQASRICGLGFRRFLWSHVESKIGM